MKHKTEAFDLWQYLCADIFAPLIRCKIDFNGFLDETLLKQAVTASLETLPMIGLCFDGAQVRPRWINKGFSAEDIVRVIHVKEEAEPAVLRRLSAGIDFANEPQLKLFIVRRQDGDTLCAVISHMVCDGAGFKQYVYLLSELYTKLKNHTAAEAPPLAARGIKPLFAGITLKEKLQIVSSRYTAYKSSNQTEQHGIDFKQGASVTVIEKRTLSKETFGRLKAFAKSKNATVNDVLMALFARSFCKNTGTEKIMFPCTMDLRKFIPAGREYGISNYSSNCMCHMTVSPESALANTVKQTSEQMNVHKANQNILKSVMLWNFAAHLPWSLLKRNFPKVVTQPIISFTNLGIIDAGQLRFDGLVITDAYLTASIKPRPYLQLTVSTYNGCCTLSCNIYGSEADRQFVYRLLDDMCTEAEVL